MYRLTSAFISTKTNLYDFTKAETLNSKDQCYDILKLTTYSNACHCNCIEYACPVWHTNRNRHLTESIETVQKRALKCIYPGNEYADILCLTNLPCLKKTR